MSKMKKEKSPEELLYQQSFGSELKQLLKTVGITQLEFSKQIKVHFNTVGSWIKGKTFPEPLIFKRIVTFFLTNPKSKNFDIYKLILIKSSQTHYKSEFENIIKTLKKNFDNERVLFEKEIIKLKNIIIDLKKTNQQQSKMVCDKNELDKSWDKYFDELKKLRQEKENYRKEIKSTEIASMYQRLLNATFGTDRYKGIVDKVLLNREISSLINKYSVSKCIIYDDLIVNIRNSVCSAMSYEIYQYFKELSNEIVNV